MSKKSSQLKVNSLLSSIYRRVGITHAKAFLSDLSIDTSLGWDKLVTDLSEDVTNHSWLCDQLEYILQDLLMYGAKFFECYDVDETKLLKLFEILDSSNPSSFQIENLPNIDKGNPHQVFDLFAKQDSQTSTTYYFIDTEEYTENVVLERDAIKDGYYFDEDFDRIVATSKRKKIFINSIRYEKKQHKLFLLIDRADEIGLRDLRKIKESFKYSINSLFDEVTGDTFFSKASNLIEKVGSLYDDESVGIVKDLKFLCPSGTVRYEALTVGNKFDDLRDEIYHKAGMEKIEYVFDPFYITLSFEEGELCLLGQKVMTRVENPKSLTEGIIRKSYNDSSYSYLFNTLNDA